MFEVEFTSMRIHGLSLYIADEDNEDVMSKHVWLKEPICLFLCRTHKDDGIGWR